MVLKKKEIKTKVKKCEEVTNLKYGSTDPLGKKELSSLNQNVVADEFNLHNSEADDFKSPNTLKRSHNSEADDFQSPKRIKSPNCFSTPKSSHNSEADDFKSPKRIKSPNIKSPLK